MIRWLFLFLSTLTLCHGFAHLSSARCISSPTALQASDGEGEKPFAVVVQATIEPNRMAEFLELIKTNAEETRKEPGCLRFDVLRSQDSPNEFFFYELYTGPSAIDHHKKQPHYNLWADFKASGGTIESVSYKTDAEFLT
mmetsp:Transcript_1094/g.2212  ORF Transcript_1094/g.2212 Transcript_1094/m.2212 type:complete len:140 (+) Transcript_1094:58-477(+)|eukprot:scaffold1640_cov161-Amphora_coffeaeformis.AAC.17